MKNTDNTVGLNTSCVYTHTFSDKSVYVGAAKTLSKRDQSFEARNETYAKKLEQFGSPTISIVNTFDTSDGDYTEVAAHEREVYDLLKDMGVEMVNGSAPLGVPNPWWTDHPIYKMIEEGRHPSTIAIENGTHHFITDNPNVRRIEDGTHHFLGGELQRENSRKRIEDRTHNFLTDHPNKDGKVTKRLIEEGRHPSFDYTVYAFECFKGPDIGATFTGMRSELYKEYPYIHQGNMSAHIRGVGYPNGTNGWRLAKQ